MINHGGNLRDELVQIPRGRSAVVGGGNDVRGPGRITVTLPVEEGVEELIIQVWGSGNTRVFMTYLGKVPGNIHVDFRVSHGDLVEPWLLLGRIVTRSSCQMAIR